MLSKGQITYIVSTWDVTWPPCSSPRRHSRAQGNRESRGGRTQPTCRARATSNQAFVDIIIARKRAPSHRVFVAQVFGRNMCGKRRRRHRFSAFWLRSSVVYYRRAKAACSFLHHIAQERASQKLLDLPDQGKTARAMTKDAFANGSSWMFTGLNMRFKDWRFVHRARMNVVPTNKNISKWNDLHSPKCRVCQSTDETLPHILCHCNNNMLLIRERHNKIVERLRKASRVRTSAS